MSDDINKLTQLAANNIAGRKVIIDWRGPSSESALGEACKTQDDHALVRVCDNLVTVNAKFEVLFHECLHIRHDWDILPVVQEKNLAAMTVKRTQSQRQAWRSNPRELANRTRTEELIRYAEVNAYKYWQAGRSLMACKLLALIDWEE